MKLDFPTSIKLLIALCCMSTAARAQYVLGSPDTTLNSSGWALGSGNMSGFSSQVTNSANFGSGGVVSRSVTISNLSSITAGTLATVNGLMVPWWSNGQATPQNLTDINNAFHSGMDLWLLDDDSGHNPLEATLGITSTAANGSPSNGTAPFFSGPFGTATNTLSFGTFEQFNLANITALGGTVIGMNTSGQITAVYWARGAFAPGSGALIVFSDVDMISNANQNPFSPLNSNGILALNTMATLVTAVPEPSTYALMGLGGLVLLARRLRATRAAR